MSYHCHNNLLQVNAVSLRRAGHSQQYNIWCLASGRELLHSLNQTPLRASSPNMVLSQTKVSPVPPVNESILFPHEYWYGPEFIGWIPGAPFPDVLPGPWPPQAELLQAERRLQAEQEASQEIQRQLNRTRSQDGCDVMHLDHLTIMADGFGSGKCM